MEKISNVEIQNQKYDNDNTEVASNTNVDGANNAAENDN
jgi:hypothetical protein